MTDTKTTDGQGTLPLDGEGDSLRIELDEGTGPAGDENGGEAVEAELVEPAEEGATALAPAPAAALQEPTGLAKLATADQIEHAITRVVARAKATERFKVALLAMTNTRDWYNHEGEGDEGNPYLAESGSEKVVHAFEIEVDHDGGTKEPAEEGGYEFVYRGKMRALAFSDLWYSVVGSRWSQDGFFTRGGKRTPDPGDIRKAAWCNFMNRGIKTVCGLKTVTWDELEAIPGFENLRDRVPKIGYKSGGGKGNGGGQPGEVDALEKGPHIKVRIDKNDLASRDAIKKLPNNVRTWNGNKGCYYWVLLFTEAHFKLCADLHAANSQVKFQAFNVPEDQLPV